VELKIEGKQSGKKVSEVGEKKTGKRWRVSMPVQEGKFASPS